MKLSDLYWHRITPLHIVLWPLSLLFGLYLQLRKLCYWLDFFQSVKLPVPVIVVDSITTCDGGKTPVTIWLAETLLARGLHPGIVTQGDLDSVYEPEDVSKMDDPISIGNKALLLAKHFENTCPVWVGRDSANTAQALLQAYPDCNVIICTYGLQNPRLERDLELAVADLNESSFGNGLQLPAGPLLANIKRLHSVDSVIINSAQKVHLDTSEWAPCYPMKLVTDNVYRLSQPATSQPISTLKDHELQVIVTYDNTQWLAGQLQQSGLRGKLSAVAEDHRFVEQDFSLVKADAIIMLEEEALQCQTMPDDRIWALPVEAWVNGEIQALILSKLRKRFTDPEVLHELVCPNCKCQLRHQQNTLICDRDRLVFPIKDGIPVLQLQKSDKLAA